MSHYFSSSEKIRPCQGERTFLLFQGAVLPIQSPNLQEGSQVADRGEGARNKEKITSRTRRAVKPTPRVEKQVDPVSINGQFLQIGIIFLSAPPSAALWGTLSYSVCTKLWEKILTLKSFIHYK